MIKGLFWFTELCPQGSNWQWFNNGSGNGLVLPDNYWLDIEAFLGQILLFPNDKCSWIFFSTWSFSPNPSQKICGCLWGWRMEHIWWVRSLIYIMCYHWDIWYSRVPTETKYAWLYSQKTAHTLPLRASCGLSFVKIGVKIDHIIMAPHCITIDCVITRF